MAFSGALTLTDLNDYLGPSQACIKPVSGAPDAPVDDAAAASTSIAIDADGTYFEQRDGSTTAAAAASAAQASQPRARTRLETAQISLDDCLACSGCVTSAEAVLVGMQSTAEMRNKLSGFAERPVDSRPLLVASIAPQVLSSLSARYTHASDLVEPLTDRQLLARISHFLRSRFAFDVVHDTTFARHLSLRAHQREFAERRKAKQQLPMLASACPGWVCYAEKTHGELLPLLSRTRSPQQMAGLLAKRALKEWHGRAAVYHVAVMPCYDKKLEASRPDFAQGSEEEKERDVDCVITTGELDTLMREEGFELLDAVAAEAEQSEASLQRIPDHVPAAGSSSGGYLFSLLADVWRTHLESLPPSAPQPLLDVRTIRSADYTEYVLRAADSDEVLFRGAACYGFRNLQNLVRRVQRSTGLKGKNTAAAGRLVEDSDAPRRGRGGMVRRGRGAGAAAVARNGADEAYDYVEVMACPGGCVNGGGQLRPPTNVLEGQEQPDPGANSLVARALAAADSTEMQIDGQGSSSGVATPLSTGGEEEVRGWKGTSREWVRKVEARYFADSPAGSVHAAQALGVGGTPAEAQRTVQAALAREVEDGVRRQELLDAITRAVEAQLCGGKGDEALRTQYHAVSDEAISGLAVQW